MTDPSTSPAIRPRRLGQLLRRLLDIYSPSGKEGEILDYLRSYLRRHGLPTIEQPLDGHRYNLLVLPPDTDIRLLLVGHVDTVAAHELDDFGHEEQGDRILGLGAADMKGGCAAMVEAFISLWESGCHTPPVGLALVVGEEEDGDGTRRLVRDYHFPWALIGEPTNLQPCLSHYGYVEIELTTRGQRMHASLANLAPNPIESMLHLLLKISQFLRCEHPEIVYNIRECASSPSGFAVPERCSAWLDLHLPPQAPLGEITLEIEEIVSCERHLKPDFDGSIRFTTIHAGYELPEKGAIIESLKAVFAQHSMKWMPQPFRSHSDANLFWAAGVKPVLLGCGALEQAHAPEESVSFEQVLVAARLYLNTMLHLIKH